MNARHPTVDELTDEASFTDAANTAAVSYRCERCGAEPGEWCRTTSGRRAQYIHAPRLDPVWSVMQWAWSLGERETKEYLNAD